VAFDVVGVLDDRQIGRLAELIERTRPVVISMRWE
jgi:hypothetical protein